MQHDIQNELSAPFDDSDIEWRLQWASEEKGTGIAVPYVTNRAIQNRLDKTVGVDGWKNEYIPWHNDGKKASQLCGISIYFESRGEWITKFDGAEDSEIESVKGGLSDSMKRSAVQWGIGRYLYSMDTVYVDVEKPGKTVVIKKSSQAKLDEAHQRTVRKMFGAGQPTQQPQPAPQSARTAPQSQQNLQEGKPTPAQQAATLDKQDPSSKPAQPPKQVQQPVKPAQPAQPASLPAKQSSPQPLPQQQAQQTPKLAPVQQLNSPVKPAPAIQHPSSSPEAPVKSYCVLGTSIKPALSGQNTLMQLKGTDGKIILAYMQGTDPAIVKGTWIDNVAISQKTNEGLIFYVLDSFDIRAPMAA